MGIKDRIPPVVNFALVSSLLFGAGGSAVHTPAPSSPRTSGGTSISVQEKDPYEDAPTATPPDPKADTPPPALPVPKTPTFKDEETARKELGCALSDELEPDLQQAITAAYARMEREGIRNFRVTDCQRSEAEQEEAFRKGTAKVHCDESSHCHSPSMAVDFVFTIRGEFPHDGWQRKGDFEHVAHIIQEEGEKLGLSLTWGGDWKNFVDAPHIEHSDWSARVAAGRSESPETGRSGR